MADEKKQQSYFELQMHNQQLQSMHQQLQKIEEQAMELAAHVEMIKEASTLKKGSEILIPLANGIFMKASSLEVDGFLVGVGSGTVVKKSFEQTLELLHGQQLELVNVRDKLTGKMQELIEKCKTLEASLNE